MEVSALSVFKRVQSLNLAAIIESFSRTACAFHDCGLQLEFFVPFFSNRQLSLEIVDRTAFNTAAATNVIFA